MKNWLLIISLPLFLLVGCGQMGNLYLPGVSTPEENKNDVYLLSDEDRAQHASLSK